MLVYAKGWPRLSDASNPFQSYVLSIYIFSVLTDKIAALWTHIVSSKGTEHISQRNQMHKSKLPWGRFNLSN